LVAWRRATGRAARFGRVASCTGPASAVRSRGFELGAGGAVLVAWLRAQCGTGSRRTGKCQVGGDATLSRTISAGAIVRLVDVSTVPDSIWASNNSRLAAAAASKSGRTVVNGGVK
jgi:hypothetical protein